MRSCKTGLFLVENQSGGIPRKTRSLRTKNNNKMLLRRFAIASKKKSQTQQKCWNSTTKKSTGPKFVFLEGGAATGKSTIINYLDRMGYRVKIETFVSLCEKVKFKRSHSKRIQDIYHKEQSYQ
jgi:hypothetical protein